jgi:hypothetical protein
MSPLLTWDVVAFCEWIEIILVRVLIYFAVKFLGETIDIDIL